MKKLLLIILMFATFTTTVSASTPHERTDRDRGIVEGYFRNRYNEKFLGGGSVIQDEFFKYLGISGEEYRAVAREYFGEEHFTSWRIFDTGLIEHTTLFWEIIIFDIPDEVIIDAIKVHNEHCKRVGFGYRVFTDEDIAALLTRCEETVTAQFATEATIVIGNRAFSPSWINLHTLEEIQAVGITPQMIEEKLPIWSDLVISAEIETSFDEKLSEFLGRDVVLINERAVNTSDAILILRAIAGLDWLSDRDMARYNISGKPTSADAVRILRIVAGL
ncbi:MAG: hypothetical protein FWD48_02720 [Oscillospiraceae bacterium]|nr:hypothetical protein [Oscillospiraceae bacterium]